MGSVVRVRISLRRWREHLRDELCHFAVQLAGHVDPTDRPEVVVVGRSGWSKRVHCSRLSRRRMSAVSEMSKSSWSQLVGSSSTSTRRRSYSTRLPPSRCLLPPIMLAGMLPDMLACSSRAFRHAATRPRAHLLVMLPAEALHEDCECNSEECRKDDDVGDDDGHER